MRFLPACVVLVLSSSYALAEPLERQIAGSRVMSLTESGLSRFGEIDEEGRRHQYRVRTESVTMGEGKNKKTYQHHFFEYVVSPGRPILIGRWSSENENARVYAPLGVRLSKEGQAYAAVRVSYGPKKDRKTDILWFRSGRSMRSLAKGESWNAGRLLLGENDAPIFFWRSAFTLFVYAGDARKALSDASMYDWSVTRLANGEVYLFLHNYNVRSLVAYTAKEGEWDWKEDFIDTEESGWQHSIATTNEHVYVAYYFYRNSFNKGVKIAQLGAREVLANETYHREKDFNAGWEPLLAISKANRVHVSFLSNVSTKQKKTDSYESPQDLMAYATDNEHSYVDGWEDNYRNWFLFGGPETAYQFWTVIAPTPSLSDAPQQFDASYDYDPSLFARAIFEARWGSTNLGINYTQNLLADTIEDGLGTTAKRVFNFVGGFIGFDKLFLGQDVRVSVAAGELQGAYTDQNGTVSTPTELYEFELSLLNQYRARFGLSYRQYELRQPIYKYSVDSGQEEFEFVGSTVVDAAVKRLELFVGYSKLDYLSKYENYYNGFDIEGKLGGGISFMSWNSVTLGGDTSSMTIEPTAMGQLRLVYLYFKRFYGLHGLGMYFRAGYGADLYFNGFTSGKPSDREQDEDSDGDDLAGSESVLRAVHYQLQHGPFLGFGIVY